MTVTLAPFERRAHLPGVIALATRIREVDRDYPPPDLDEARFAEWLMEPRLLGRWVAHDGDALIGHVLLAPAHGYLRAWLPEVESDSLAEIGRLLVAPEHRRRGVGRLLLHAAAERSRRLGLVPALAVLSTSHAAIALYRREGWREHGPFEGRHGPNHVFVAPSAAGPSG